MQRVRDILLCMLSYYRAETSLDQRVLATVKADPRPLLSTCPYFCYTTKYIHSSTLCRLPSVPRAGLLVAVMRTETFRHSTMEP